MNIVVPDTRLRRLHIAPDRPNRRRLPAGYKTQLKNQKRRNDGREKFEA
jgi:hypothetical protein